MPQFQNREEYKKWKAVRLKETEEKVDSEQYTKDKNNEENLEYHPKRKNSNGNWFRNKFIIAIFIILTIILIISGYFYLKKKHELSIYKKDAGIVITEFEKLSASLEIGMSYKDYTDKLGQINYFLSGFLEKYKKYGYTNDLYRTTSNIMNIHLSCAENWKRAIDLGDSYFLKLTEEYLSRGWISAHKLTALTRKLLEANSKGEKKKSYEEIANAEKLMRDAVDEYNKRRNEYAVEIDKKLEEMKKSVGMMKK